MSSTGNPTGMPNINQPLTGDGNIITRPWFLLVQTLFNRTGGASGGLIVPTGVVNDFAGHAVDCPLGWLLCGQDVSRIQYSVLFALIGTLWGAGDGSTTFGLPPQTGSFVRIIKA